MRYHRLVAISKMACYDRFVLLCSNFSFVNQCTMLPAQYIESAYKHVLNGHDGLAMVSYAIGEDAAQFSASYSHYLSQNS